MRIKDFANKRISRSSLQQVFWECTLRCNLNCRHCGSDCKKNNAPVDMPLDDFLPVLDEISSCEDPSKIMIVTTGGEPLLRTDICECGYEISKKGFIWGMVSNGMLLDSDMLQKLMEAGLKSIAISLDGLEEEHNWLRCSNVSFRYAIKAIEALRASSVVWDVITCVNSRNINKLNSFKEFLISAGVKKWRIFSIAPIGRAIDNVELQLSDIQFKQLLDFIFCVKQENIINLSYSCEGYLDEYEMKVRDYPFFCGAGINIASVRHDGAISGCLSIRSKFDQGNIYKDSFIEVWTNGFKVFRNRSWLKTDICLDCKVWKYCNGGAFHLRKSSGGMTSCSYLKLNENRSFE